MLIEPDNSEIYTLLQKLYESFRTGAEFEAFLRVLLNKIGLEDVAVTQYSRDGGIDLIARRPGLAELSRFDEVKYVVQAKRYKPGNRIPIESVRALRGVMGQNDKGLFITTGRFSTDTQEFADQDQTRPIVLIDGERLVRLCIDYHLGFRFRPVFDKDFLMEEGNRLSVQNRLPTENTPALSPDVQTFVKTITSNDIRARIISTPWELDTLIDSGDNILKVEFPPHFSVNEYRYQRDRRYIGGVTPILRKFGLLDKSGERHPKLAEWTVQKGQRTITVRIVSDDAKVD